MKATGGKAEKQCQVQSGAQCQQPASESPPGSSPSCPFIPPPLFMRAQPLPTASQAQRAEGTGCRAAHETAHSGAEDTKALSLPPGPRAAAPRLLPQDLGWVSGLSCSFCKMGAQCEPSGVAMRGGAELVGGGCWDGKGPRQVLTSSSQSGPGRV